MHLELLMPTDNQADLGGWQLWQGTEEQLWTGCRNLFNKHGCSYKRMRVCSLRAAVI